MIRPKWYEITDDLGWHLPVTTYRWFVEFWGMRYKFISGRTRYALTMVTTRVTNPSIHARPYRVKSRWLFKVGHPNAMHVAHSWSYSIGADRMHLQVLFA